MSSSVDSRIVTMKFDNAQFEKGVKTTTDSLAHLNKSLQFPGAAKGLEGVQGAIEKVNFGPLEGGITKVSASFMAMATVALTALSNITNKAIDAGMQMAKSLTLDPIMAGFKEYELKMGAIQTIMAGSGESLEVVNQKLKELNEYSDKTIYSFADMTQNIGKFTNAGVSLDQSVAAIKGISNGAALSGPNAEEASMAMYNFAQSLSAGSVKLMDWKSIELANMATKEFKTELLESAVAAGKLQKTGEGMYKTLEGTPVTATKGFNESLEQQWLTSEALISTLGRYSDATTDIGARATAAASDVKTFSQMIDTMRESAGSGWAETSELIIGNFEEAKKLWTGVNNVIGGMIQDSAKARNEVLALWKSAGGREVLLEALKNAFDALMKVITPIKEAFREIFPRKTAADLVKMTIHFREFTEKLKLSDETMANLKSTFKGVFAIFSIIGQIIGGVIGVISKLIGSLSGTGGGFLAMTGSLGDFISGIDAFLKKGDKLKKFFDTLGDVLAVPIKLFSILIGFIGDIFSYFKKDEAEEVNTALEKVGNTLSPLDVLVERVSEAFKGLAKTVQKVADFLRPLFDAIGNALSAVWDALTNAFSTGNFDKTLDLINTGLFAGLVIIIKRFLGGGLFGASGIGGVMESIQEAFGSLTGVLESMQMKVKADALLKLAIAVGILTVSIIALSMIDSAKLTKAMTAITVAFAQLMVAMKIMEGATSSKGLYKMPIIATSLILLATALVILTAAVKNMSELSWSELAKGLGGLAVLLFIINKAIEPLSKNTGSMIKASIGIMVLSVALKVLASVVKDFGEMDWSTIGQGLASMAGALAVIAATMKLMPKNMVPQAISLLVLSVALKVIAQVVSKFGEMDWGTIGRGLIGMAGALAVIAQTMYMMPKNMIVTAAGLIVVGVALGFIAAAVGKMGAMGWDEVAKGLIVLAGSLIIIAVALYAMQGTIAGAAALIVAAVALKLLAGVLKTLGSMNVGDIVQGLLALAGIFLVLGVAAVVLTPVVPIILGLGIAVGLIGTAMLMAGLGVLAFVTAIMILMALGAGAAAAIGLLLKAIIDKIPDLFAALAQGIVDFAETIANSGSQFADAVEKLITSIAQGIIDSAPKVFEAITTLLTGFYQMIIDTAPKAAEAFTVLITTFLDTIVTLTPRIVQAGYDVVISVLNGIAENIDDVITAGVNVVQSFLDGIGRNLDDIAQSAAELIIDFVNAISTAIDNNAEALGRAGGKLAGSIIKGIIKGFTGGISEVGKAAREVAQSALDSAKDFLKISSPSKAFMDVGLAVAEGFAVGIHDNANIVNQSVISMGDGALDSMKTTMEKLADLVAKEVSLDPTITPTLDLTKVQQEAGKLTDMFAPTVSYSQAASISETQGMNREVISEPTAQPATLVNFEQNNYSPKALSSVEIYRQTKNQLSLAKEALNV